MRTIKIVAIMKQRAYITIAVALAEEVVAEVVMNRTAIAETVRTIEEAEVAVVVVEGDKTTTTVTRIVATATETAPKKRSPPTTGRRTRKQLLWLLPHRLRLQRRRRSSPSVRPMVLRR